jgi:hypothetical protein
VSLLLLLRPHGTPTLTGTGAGPLAVARAAGPQATPTAAPGPQATVRTDRPRG